MLIEMSSAHGRGLMRGIANFAQQHPEWSLRLEESGPFKAAPPPWIKAWSGDGIIARIETPQIARALLAKRVPLVNVAGRTSPPGVPRVDTDNRTVCELAANHFLERGYRNFAYCGNPHFEWSGWRRDYFSGLLAADHRPCSVFQLAESAAGGKQLVAWLASLPKPVGVFAANDQCGCAVLQACAAGGLEVPAEVAVLGVDNDEILCTLCRPPLSSVVPDTEGIGYLAAETLQALMEGRGPTPPFVKPLTVCSRQSTDAAAVGDWHVSRALRFILGHARRGINVDDVVAQSHASRRFLEKRFRAVVGRSIHEEIFRIRFEFAQSLLATTALPLKEIAVRSGLRRADYLSAVFRERLGLAPRTFREARQGRLRNRARKTRRTEARASGGHR